MTPGEFSFFFPFSRSLHFSLDFLELQLLIYRMEERVLTPNRGTKESMAIKLQTPCPAYGKYPFSAFSGHRTLDWIS